MAQLLYKRILLKLSGESLMGSRDYGIDPQVLNALSEEIRTVQQLGVEIGIVIGGGNIYRGVDQSADGIDRVTGDHMGMLATVINALALQNSLEKHGVYTRCQAAIDMERIAEPFIRRRAIRHLEKGRIVIFAAGTGNPYFTTDTAAALRAIEIEAQVLLMAKNRVDGVYSADPLKHKDAVKFDRLTHLEALSKRLKVMDATALSLCLENKLPIIVFDMTAPGNLERAVAGEPVGTLISSES